MSQDSVFLVPWGAEPCTQRKKHQDAKQPVHTAGTRLGQSPGGLTSDDCSLSTRIWGCNTTHLPASRTCLPTPQPHSPLTGAFSSLSFHYLYFAINLDGCVHKPSSTWRLTQEDYCEFKDSLGNIARRPCHETRDLPESLLTEGIGGS